MHAETWIEEVETQMRNFAEEIAYWYYRLNHFFLLQSFVMHRAVESKKRRESVEIDLLGVKPPNATEYVRIEDRQLQLQPDHKLLSLLKLDQKSFDEFCIYLMAEVTSGKGEQRSKFDSSRVGYNLQRLGLHEHIQADSLEGSPMKKLGNKSIICKIFLSEEGNEKEENFFVIPLEYADSFVKERMSLNFKQRDWHLFSSNYIQSKIIFSR